MYLIKAAKKSLGLDKYTDLTQHPCNLDILAHMVTGRQGAGDKPSAEEIKKHEPLLDILRGGHIAYIYDLCSYSPAFVMIISRNELVVVKYTMNPGYDNYLVSSTNDLVDRLEIRGKNVTDLKVIAAIFNFPTDDLKSDEDEQPEPEPTEQEPQPSGYRWNWNNQPAGQETATEVAAEVIDDNRPVPPAPPATSNTNNDVSDATIRHETPATQRTSPPPGPNQMETAFQQAERRQGGQGQQNRGERREHGRR